MKDENMRKDQENTEDKYQQLSFLEEGAEAEEVNLAGFQVTRGQLFSHLREPTVTFWEDRIRFNMACLRRFPQVTHIQLLIHPDQKRLIIRPCDPDAPDSLRWATKGGSSDELKNRDMICRIFAAKVYDLMNWEKNVRYKVMGRPAVAKGEALFLFKLTDSEQFITSGRKTKSYLNGEWRDYFGLPVEQHEEAYHIDLADGYIQM